MHNVVHHTLVFLILIVDQWKGDTANDYAYCAWLHVLASILDSPVKIILFIWDFVTLHWRIRDSLGLDQECELWQFKPLDRPIFAFLVSIFGYHYGINIFYPREYFYVGLLRLDFFCRYELQISQLSKVKRKFLEVIQKFPRGPGALCRFFIFFIYSF